MIHTATFYPKFRRVSRLPLFKRYLNWGYSQGIKDLAKLNYKPDFNKKDFTCLLCGCASEITADIFIKFVLSKNSKATIYITDIGKEQIEAVNNLIKERYPADNIIAIKADLLKLDSLMANSIDWIETDAVLGYFDENELGIVLKKWSIWLKDNGFITMREAAVSGLFSLIADYVKRWGAKVFFASKLHQRRKETLDSTLTRAGFRFVSGPTPFPSLCRYSIVK